jgi:hypothetical protein
MLYYHFLARLHQALAPRTYLEIGVRSGQSLALARCRSVGVDPAFEVKEEMLAPVSLVRRTSNDFFAQVGPGGPFGGMPVDLAFIDGMHLFEYALADFAHTEPFTAWSSVAVFDDVCPREAAWATRKRETVSWTGDIFKVEQALRTLRPDLTFVQVDTEPTGLLLVFGLDSTNRLLAQTFNQIVGQFVTEDPQDVPAEVLNRAQAVPPQAILSSPVWQVIRDGRDRLAPDAGRAHIRAALADLAVP